MNDSITHLTAAIVSLANAAIELRAERSYDLAKETIKVRGSLVDIRAASRLAQLETQEQEVTSS